MAKWIKFEYRCKSKSGKTQIWSVYSTDDKYFLGQIAWYPQWRKYSFFPTHDSVLENDCLRDIADFCEAETKKHKLRKKK